MSEIKISQKLLNDMKALLVDHDQQAMDPIMYAQYLAAITGLTVADLGDVASQALESAPGEETNQENDLRQLLQQLFGYATFAFNQRLEEQPEQREEKLEGEDEQVAEGVWDPNASNKH